MTMLTKKPVIHMTELPRIIGSLKDGQHFNFIKFSQVIDFMLNQDPTDSSLIALLDHYRATVPSFQHFKSTPRFIHVLLKAKEKSMSEYNRALIIMDEQYSKEALNHSPFIKEIPSFFQFYNDRLYHIY